MCITGRTAMIFFSHSIAIHRSKAIFMLLSLQQVSLIIAFSTDKYDLLGIPMKTDIATSWVSVMRSA